MPSVSEGRDPSTPGEVAVSSTLGHHVGDEIQIGVRTMQVVGIVPNSTSLAKMPNVFLTTQGVQQLAYNGQPIVTSIAIQGTPRQLPDGYQTVGRAAGVDDLTAFLKSPVAQKWVEQGHLVRTDVLSAVDRDAAFAEQVQGVCDLYTRPLGSDEAAQARQYLTERNFDADAARRFGCGFAPPGWETLTKHLQLRNG